MNQDTTAEQLRAMVNFNAAIRETLDAAERQDHAAMKIAAEKIADILAQPEFDNVRARAAEIIQRAAVM